MGKEGMAIINTRSHIVLNKEYIKKYSEMLDSAYVAIFEINTGLDAYQRMFSTGERFPQIEAGTGKEFIKAAKKYVHTEDINRFLAIFRRKNLSDVIKAQKQGSAEFRGLTPEGQYRWMRVLLAPDETEKNTLLCFMIDIDAQKRCSILEQENRELLEKINTLSQHQGQMAVPRTGRKIFNLPSYRRRIKETAVK